MLSYAINYFLDNAPLERILAYSAEPTIPLAECSAAEPAPVPILFKDPPMCQLAEIQPFRIHGRTDNNLAKSRLSLQMRSSMHIGQSKVFTQRERGRDYGKKQQENFVCLRGSPIRADSGGPERPSGSAARDTNRASGAQQCGSERTDSI